MEGEIKLNIPTKEKSACCNNLRLYLSYIFHFVAMVSFWFTMGAGVLIWRRMLMEDLDVNDPRIWLVKWFPACYLTNWNLLFQTLFLSMSLTYDILEWMDRHDSKFGQLLAYLRDMFFSAVIVPLALFIFITFWGFYWYDRELVFPRIYDNLVPGWFNHCVHTNILIVIILETLLQARRHPANLKIELGLVGLVVVAYGIVFYSIYFITKLWLYGLFAMMNWWQVCLYQILIFISHYVFYGIQFPINRLFHREQTSQEVVQVTEDRSKGKKTREPTLVSGSWSQKFRSKSGCEDVCL